MEFTHIANPVRVQAHEIVQVIPREDGAVTLKFSDAMDYVAGHEMLARHSPNEGDYLVFQEDNYAYINPKDVFERKYRVIGTSMASDHPANAGFRSRTNEDELRARALDYASRHYNEGSPRVVKAAEDYYQFLKGSST